MNNNSNTNNNNNFEIPLQLSNKLKKEDIIQNFVINQKHKYVKIELNHKYVKSTIIITTINIKDWNKFHESVKKALEYKGVHNQEHIRLITDVFDDNHNLVLGINDNDEYYEYDGEGKREEEDEKSLPQILVERVLENSTTKLFKDEFNIPYILIMINDHYQTLPIDSTKFKRYLSKLYYDTYGGKIANTEAVNSAIQQLEAKSFFEGDTIPLHLRVAWNNNPDTIDSIYYDLSDSKNRCVKITSDGWTILDNQTDVLFRWYDHQLPQIEPFSVDNLDDQDDVLEQFIDLLNIKNYNDRLLLKCYIISLFIPEIAHVILILLGEQGGAKSTLQELVKMLVDPSIYLQF